MSATDAAPVPDADAARSTAVVSAPVAHDESLAPAAIRVVVPSDPDAHDVLVTNGIAVDVEGDPIAEDVSNAVAAGGVAVLGAPTATLVPETAAPQASSVSEPDADGVEEAEAASGAGGGRGSRSRRHGTGEPSLVAEQRVAKGAPAKPRAQKNKNAHFSVPVTPSATRCA